jgi:hypothetical protein
MLCGDFGVSYVIQKNMPISELLKVRVPVSLQIGGQAVILGIIFGGMLFELWELQDVPVTFKESLWHTLVDHATVYADERIVFCFKDGTEVTTML